MSGYCFFGRSSFFLDLSRKGKRKEKKKHEKLPLTYPIQPLHVVAGPPTPTVGSHGRQPPAYALDLAHQGVVARQEPPRGFRFLHDLRERRLSQLLLQVLRD